MGDGAADAASDEAKKALEELQALQEGATLSPVPPDTSTATGPSTLSPIPTSGLETPPETGPAASIPRVPLGQRIAERYEVRSPSLSAGGTWPWAPARAHS